MAQNSSVYHPDQPSWDPVVLPVVTAEASGSSIDIVSADESNKATLFLNDYGDLMVSQEEGPNAGKTANLTYGKWIIS